MARITYHASMATYHWLRVRAAGPGWADEYARLRASTAPGIEIWGAFYGLFGIGSNELLLVVRSEDGPPTLPVTAAGFEVTESHALVPTVRPEKFEPITRPGLYVFRLFEVANKDVDEIARLSSEAWASFENADSYTAEAKGLFAQADRSHPNGAMVLLTWYDGLDSWQASRRPAPEAVDNFRRRRALTQRSVAYATRLVGN